MESLGEVLLKLAVSLYVLAIFAGWTGIHLGASDTALLGVAVLVWCEWSTVKGFLSSRL